MPVTNNPLLAAGLCLCAVVVLAACGNGAPSPSSSGPVAGSAGINLGTPGVRIGATDQLHFVPASETLHVGDILQWTNTGTVAHTVTFDNQPYLTDPTLAPGATWEIKLTTAGTYPYRCTIHPGMDGTLVVVP